MRRMSVFAVLLGLCLSPAAMAAEDWLVISTVGAPDTIDAFDLNVLAPVFVGNVDGNFNRGMDCDSPNSFYYLVSTDTLNDPGDRGLWYWDNGVNTQLFELPFSDSGDGDAALSNDGSTFYVTIQDDDAIGGDSLYKFENLNGAVTFTEVGETGLSQIIGLAMEPGTGQLFGYDADTEGLYKISSVDGSVELIGFSGESLGAIGGMDFSEDGTTLLLSQGGEMYDVDRITGALNFKGDLGVNVSALSYRISGIVPCPFDLDNNGAVGPGDVGVVKNSFGCDINLPECAALDFDSNGAVGPGDVGAVKNNFGPCP